MREFIQKILECKNLSYEEAKKAMHCIMSGKASEAQIASFLTALRMRGESIEEITAFAEVMREFAHTINPRVDMLIDTCGTGGDKIKTFNISTISAFVIAGCGIPVAKHGNRAVTSKAGSADMLEALKVSIDLKPEHVERLIEDIGIGFLFAPVFHKAMKNAVKPRREIGIRTVFNILGPLTNPANAKAQLLGVFSPELTEVMAKVLKNLGVKRAMVVHGLHGLDELSTLGKTKVTELKEGKIETYYISPEDFGIRKARIEEILGGSAEYNAEIALDILKGNGKARKDIVILNAGAGIYLGGKASGIEEGIELARESIDSGKALKKLREFIARSKGNGKSKDMRDN